MVSGGVVQLISYGAQDVYISGGPKTIFKSYVKKVNNFAIDSVKIPINGMGNGNPSVLIPRNGDLIKSIRLEITLKKGTGQSFYPAEQLISYLALKIGGNIIQKIDDFSNFCRIRNELFMDPDERHTDYRVNNFSSSDVVGSVKYFFLDLPLFFSKDTSVALPLIALQYHDIELDFRFNDVSTIQGVDASYTPTIEMYIDYVYLEQQERIKLVEKPLFYNIEQCNFYRKDITFPALSSTFKLDIPFNNPSRFLVWYFNTDSFGIYNTSGLYFNSNDAAAPLESAVMLLNGTERFKSREGMYFNCVQPQQALGRSPSSGIYMYAFGEDVANATSKGALDMSRVNELSLQLTTKNATAANVYTVYNPQETLASSTSTYKGITLFSTNWNVLQVRSGLGAVMFDS